MHAGPGQELVGCVDDLKDMYPSFDASFPGAASNAIALRSQASDFQGTKAARAARLPAAAATFPC